VNKVNIAPKDRKTEKQKNRKTEKQKDRKTERQKDRKTERQKNRKTERQNGKTKTTNRNKGDKGDKGNKGNHDCENPVQRNNVGARDRKSYLETTRPNESISPWRYYARVGGPNRLVR